MSTNFPSKEEAVSHANHFMVASCNIMDTPDISNNQDADPRDPTPGEGSVSREPSHLPLGPNDTTAPSPGVVGLPAGEDPVAALPQATPKLLPDGRDLDLDAFLAAKNLPPHWQRYVRDASAEGSRLPNGYFSNCIEVPCERFGHANTAESAGWEYPALMTALYDPDVSTVWHQPPQLVVPIVLKNGKKATFSTTPDFLVLFKDGHFEIWEIKPRANLSRLCVEHPQRYQCSAGTYSSAPIEQHIAAFARYRIISDDNLDKPFVTAARFLQNYRMSRPSVAITSEEKQAFFDAAAAHPGIQVRDVPLGDPKRRAEVLYYLLANAEVFADIGAAPIDLPDSIRIFPNAVEQAAFEKFRSGSRRQFRVEDCGYHLKAHDLLEFDGHEFEVLRVSDKRGIYVRDDEGETRWIPTAVLVDGKARIAHSFNLQMTFQHLWENYLSEDDRVAYARRREAIAPYLPGGDMDGKAPPKKTVRNWLAAYRAQGELGIVPQYYKCGNRKPRVEADFSKVFERLIDEAYRKPGDMTVRWLRGMLVAAKQRGEFTSEIPTDRTLYRHIEKLDKYTLTLSRAGKRRALLFEKAHGASRTGASPHGERDFQVAHVDCSIEDVANAHEGDKAIMVRRSIAKMVDAFTGKILAIYRFKGRPNGMAIRALLLECIRQHGTLPQIIRCDWGPENRTRWMKDSLLRIDITLSFRPKAAPRKGAPVESAFSKSLKMLYQNLSGETTQLKHARMVTRAVDPREHTIWTDEELDRLLVEYVALHNDLPRTNKPSPNSVEEAVRERLGQPPLRGESEGQLRELLMPYVDRRVRIVSPRGLIKVGKKFFRSVKEEELLKLRGAQVLVRYDPENPNVVYVLPPNRKRMISCCEVTCGGPDTATLAAAQALDDQKFAESPLPGVSGAEILHAEFVDSVQRTEERLKKQKKAKPAPQPPPPKITIPVFNFVPRQTKSENE